MIVVSGGLPWRPGDFNTIDFTDLTTSLLTDRIRWVGEDLLLPFDSDPTAVEQGAIRRRLLTQDAADEAEVAAMQTALANLADNPNELARGLKAVLRRLLGPLGDS